MRHGSVNLILNILIDRCFFEWVGNCLEKNAKLCEEKKAADQIERKKVLLALCFKSFFEFVFAEAVPACDIVLVSREQQKKKKKML